jgi:hypothetical protein
MLIIGRDKKKNGLKELEGSRYMTTDYKFIQYFQKKPNNKSHIVINWKCKWYISCIDLWRTNIMWWVITRSRKLFIMLKLFSLMLSSTRTRCKLNNTRCISEKLLDRVYLLIFTGKDISIQYFDGLWFVICPVCVDDSFISICFVSIWRIHACSVSMHFRYTLYFMLHILGVLFNVTLNF